MFNTNDIYARLQNGERIEDIGNEIAGMMNEAMARHQAEQEAKAALAAQAEQEAAKRELVVEMCEIMREIAILEGIDPADLDEISDEMVDQMLAGITASFQLAKQLETLFGAEKVPAKVCAHRPAAEPTDEQILADFIKMFN